MARKHLLYCSLLLLLLVCVYTVSGHTISACFSSNKSLDIDCGAGYMIHITKTFYGFSLSGQCRLMEGEATTGCTVDDQTQYPCVGQRYCSINLPTGQFGINIPSCRQRSNYYQVEYSCVLASTVSDICQNEQLTAQSGYIMTPRYPANYDTQSDCSTAILVSSSQKLNLLIIDMDLQTKEKSDCADLLYFNDRLRSNTLCGQRTNYSYNMLSNYLHIELRSSSKGQSKGFWLHYEAVPPLPTSLPLPEIDDKTTQSDTRNGSGLQNFQGPDSNKGSDSNIITTTDSNKFVNKSIVPLSRNVTGSGKYLPFAAIAGGVIGTLSLILVILLVLLFIKWYQERKYSKADKILEIKNPAFRNSSDFHEVSQANNGLYC